MTIRHPLSTFLVVLLAVVMITAGMSPTAATARQDAPTVQTPTPAPATGLSLSAVLAATPPDTPDGDGDGLPDPVEAVFGTLADEPDSDLDGLEDHAEIVQGLDPVNLDSNNDGLPDGLEANGPVDVDGDGIANALDDDNDNDGVIDGLDLSPFASSRAANHINLNIDTRANPTYLEFQVVPTDEALLDRINQPWDWPADLVGTIQDLHDISGDIDIRIQPRLELVADGGPEAADVADYGVLLLDPNVDAGEMVDAWKGLVPLSPVIDHSGTVALSGTMFYPAEAPTELTAELVWTVTWIDPHRSTVALVDRDVSSHPPGGTLTNYSNGETCTVAATLAEPAAFVCDEPLTGGVAFAAGDDLEYERPDTHQQIVASVTKNAHENAPVMGRYRTPFVLTGLVATENYGAKAAVVSGDAQQVIAAGLILEYEYLRGTEDLETVEESFTDHGLSGLSTMVRTDPGHTDRAYQVAANDLLPVALDGLPAATTSPILLAVEEDSVRRQPLEWERQTPAKNLATFTVDLNDQTYRVATRSLRMDWYDSSTQDPVPDFAPVLESWDLDDEGADAIATLTLTWAAGNAVVTAVGDSPIDHSTPEWYDLSKDIKAWSGRAATLGVESISIGVALENALNAHKFVRGLAAEGAWASFKTKTVSFIDTFKTGYREAQATISSGTMSSFNRPWATLSTWSKTARVLWVAGKIANLAGILLIVGLFAYTYVQAGFTAAMMELTKNLTVFVLFEVIGLLISIGPAGWAILVVAAVVLAIGEIFGGWFTKIYDWFSSLAPTPVQYPLTEIDFSVLAGWPDAEPRDVDDNGFDVGDRVDLLTDFRTTTSSAVPSATYRDVRGTIIAPELVVEACLLRADGVVACLPSTTSTNHNVSGATASVNSTVIADPSERTYSPSELENGADGTKCSTPCSIEQITHGAIAITPKVSTTDLTLNIGVAYEGRVWISVDGTPHEATSSDDGNDDRQPITFDVLPASISDFTAWPVVSSLDDDSDGVPDSEDANPTESDADGDGLRDGLERDLGTDPEAADSDGDTIPDPAEVRNGTNPTERDTDGDGLADSAEATGWPVSFEYYGTTFNVTVTSDPVLADADGDSLTDAVEKLLGTNPNAWDTDGDGRKDAIFLDDDASIFRDDIEWLALSGITKGCNPPVNDMFCPTDYVTRGQMAAFLVRALDLTHSGVVDFVDDDTSIFESDIEKLATAGITKGCNPPVNDRFCPEDNVTRGQMAAFLHRALG